MSLFAGSLQQFLLHADEGLQAPPQQIGDRFCRWPVSCALLHPGHQEFVLFLPQFEKDLLSLNEVCDRLSRYFPHNSGGGMMGSDSCCRNECIKLAFCRIARSRRILCVAKKLCTPCCAQPDRRDTKDDSPE